MWKVWYSNEVEKFQARVVSVRRRGGKLSVAVICNGPTTYQAGTKDFETDAEVVKEAEKFVKEISDDRISFKFIDLSPITDLDAQFDEMARRGLAVTSKPPKGKRR